MMGGELWKIREIMGGESGDVEGKVKLRKISWSRES